MQEIRLGDGTDANGVAAYPFGATFGQKSLIQRVSGTETSFGYVERLRLRFARGLRHPPTSGPRKGSAPRLHC